MNGASDPENFSLPVHPLPLPGGHKSQPSPQPKDERITPHDSGDHHGKDRQPKTDENHRRPAVEKRRRKLPPEILSLGEASSRAGHRLIESRRRCDDEGLSIKRRLPGGSFALK